jgi:hypothetical protein
VFAKTDRLPDRYMKETAARSEFSKIRESSRFQYVPVKPTLPFSPAQMRRPSPLRTLHRAAKPDNKFT